MLLLRELTRGIDETVAGAVTFGEPDFVFARGTGNHARADGVADLDGSKPDAARGAQHDKRFVGFQVRAILQGVPRRAVGNEETRGDVESEILRHRDAARRVGEGLFREAPGADGGDHPVPAFRDGDSLADILDHARDLATGHKRQRRLELVFVLDQQHVGKIDAAGFDRNEHLAIAGRWRRYVAKFEFFRRPVMRAQRGFHAASPFSLSHVTFAEGSREGENAMRTIVPAALVLFMSAVPASASTNCLQIGRTWSWKALDNKTLIVEDELHQKFRLARGYCPRLPFKLNLAIRSASGINGLDCVRRGDNVISEDVGARYTCPVMSVVPLGQDIVSPTHAGR